MFPFSVLVAITLTPLTVPPPGEILSWVLWAVGFVGFVAAAAQYVRGSADSGTIKSLQNSVNALETSNDLKDEKIAELTELVKKLGGELEVWRNAVTAKEELAHLSTGVLEHHVESMKAVHQMLEMLSQILKGQTSGMDQLSKNKDTIVETTTEVKRLVARMHSELTEIRNVVKP